MRFLVYLGAGFTALVFLGLPLYILARGIPNLRPSLFAWEYNSDNASMMPALINTILMTGLSLLVAVPAASPARST
jgi:phosphate transport system permease protein